MLLVVDAGGDEHGVEDKAAVEATVAVGEAAAVEGNAVEDGEGEDEVGNLNVVAEEKEADVDPHVEE